MSCYQMSSAMNKSSNKRQFVPILLLSLMWTMMITGAMARPSLGSLLTKQNDASQMLLEDLFANANDENLFHELKNYHQKQPSYLTKWPGLRDLVLAIDYDDYTSFPMDTNDMPNNKLLERLRQLNPSNADFFEDVRDEKEDSVSGAMKSSKILAKENQFKEHNMKKNVQYMSPCHFKICNMGRKRDARLFNNN